MDKLLENLNKEQTAAVTHQSGPLLIVAGAGTGKTTVITRRIAYLTEQNLAKPDEIAALTFTEKAAGEMQERVDQLLPLGYFDRWISTYHGFCERLLKAHALDIGIPNDFTLLESTRQWIFVYKNFDKFKLNYYRPIGNPSKFIDALLSHFSRCKDEMIAPSDYLEYAQNLKLKTDSAEGVLPKTEKSENRKIGRKKTAKKSTAAAEETKIQDSDSSDQSYLSEYLRIEEIAAAYHTYQKLLLDNNFLDFGDLINYALELFARRPKILKFYQNKFKYVMVDEFQDTNVAQYELVKLLAGEKQNLAVVGDDDQSIYKFRGASVSNILKLKNDYPKLKQITLVENYRSRQNILDLAYNFIQANNPDRLEAKLGIIKQLKSSDSDSAHNKPGIIEVLEADDLAGELAAVCKKILEIKNNGEQSSWNDFAILLRRNAAADELLPILSAHNIPFTFLANRGLYKKPIIVDILAYLRLLDNFHNSTALYRVLTLPNFALAPHELSDLLLEARKQTKALHEILRQADALTALSEKAKNSIRKLLELIAKHAALAGKLTAAELFVFVLKDLGYEKKIKDDTLENAENRELIEQFYKKMEGFCQNNSDCSMHEFLLDLELEQAAGNDGEIKFDPNLGPESVKVMTIHSAKGLEFDTVFVINMVDQQFPSREKNEPIEIPGALIKDILPEGDFHLQEERRLFYVAITRAKTNLFLTWGHDYGGKRTKKPSLFLQETKLVPSEQVSRATGKVVFNKPLKLPVVYKIPPAQFSYSQLNDFEQCPLKYKYQHYLKLPVVGSHYLSFGQTMHKVFEEYLAAYKRSLDLPQQDLFGAKPPAVLPDFEFLKQLYVKDWVDNWYETKTQKEEYRAKGAEMLKTFYGTLAKTPFTPKYIEQSFVLPLGEYKFKGKIDRADASDGGIQIWDYKTGKAPKKSGKSDLDQLKIYQWAAEDFLKEKVISMKYWYLQDDHIAEEKVASPEDIGKLKSELLELVQHIVYVTKYDLFKEEHKKAPDHRCDFEYLE